MAAAELPTRTCRQRARHDLCTEIQRGGRLLDECELPPWKQRGVSVREEFVDAIDVKPRPQRVTDPHGPHFFQSASISSSVANRVFPCRNSCCRRLTSST